MCAVPKGDLRRRNGRQSKSTFTGLLLLLVLLTAGFAFMHSAFFTVGHVEVKGNKYLSAAEIYQIANIDPRINILNINGDQVRKRLLQDLRIEDVTVQRKFPATVILQIKERKTVAFVPTNYGFVQVDRQGYVLAALRSIKSMTLPMITGLKLINPKVGDQIDDGPGFILEMLGALDEETLGMLSEINVENPRSIVGYTVHAVPVKFGDVQHPLAKAELLNSVLKDIRQQKLSVEYIDIAYGAPVLKFKH